MRRVTHLSQEIGLFSGANDVPVVKVFALHSSIIFVCYTKKFFRTNSGIASCLFPVQSRERIAKFSPLPISCKILSQANMYSRCYVWNPCPSCAMRCYLGKWCLVQHSTASTRRSHSCWCCESVLLVRGWPWRFCWWLYMDSKSPHNRLCSTWTCWCTSCIDPSPRLTTWEIFARQGFFSVRSLCYYSQTRTCCGHIQQSLNCICTFCGKEHKASYGARCLSRKSRKVDYDCTWRFNHEWSIPGMFLSVSTATSWRTKAFWDRRTFLDFQTRQGCLNSRELAFSTGKGKDNKDKTRNDTADHLTRVFLNEEKWLVINDSQVLSVLRPTVLPVENDLLLITSAKRMELNRTNNSSSLTF